MLYVTSTNKQRDKALLFTIVTFDTHCGGGGGTGGSNHNRNY